MAKARPKTADERMAEVDSLLDMHFYLEKAVYWLNTVLEAPAKRRLTSQETSQVKHCCSALDGARLRIEKSALK